MTASIIEHVEPSVSEKPNLFLAITLFDIEYITKVLESNSKEEYMAALQHDWDTPRRPQNDEKIEKVNVAFEQQKDAVNNLFDKYPPTSPKYVSLLILACNAKLILYRVFNEDSYSLLSAKGTFNASKVYHFPRGEIDDLVNDCMENGYGGMNERQRSIVLDHLANKILTPFVSTSHKIPYVIWRCRDDLCRRNFQEVSVIAVHRPPSVVDVIDDFFHGIGPGCQGSQRYKAYHCAKVAGEVLLPGPVAAVRNSLFVVTSDSMGISWPAYRFKDKALWCGSWINNIPPRPLSGGYLPCRPIEEAMEVRKRELSQVGNLLKFVGQRREYGHLKMFIHDPFGENVEDLFKSVKGQLILGQFVLPPRSRYKLDLVSMGSSAEKEEQRQITAQPEETLDGIIASVSSLAFKPSEPEEGTKSILGAEGWCQ